MLRRNIFRSIPVLMGVVLLSVLVAPHVAAGASTTTTTTTVPPSQPPYIIVYGPVADPGTSVPAVATETIDSAPENASVLANTGSVSDTQTDDPSPLATDVNPGCAEYVAFAALVGLAADYCFQGGNGTVVPIGQAPGFLFNLVNSSGYRVWLTENADGTGWSDCFDHGEAYYLGDSRDAYALGLEIGTSQNPCSPAPPIETMCTSSGAMAWVPDLCMYSPNTYLNSAFIIPVVLLTNGSQHRVWENGSNWADCFDQNNIYLVSGTRDDDPSYIGVSTNSNPC